MSLLNFYNMEMDAKYLSQESVKELLLKCYTRLLECEVNIVRFTHLEDEGNIKLNREIQADLSQKVLWVEDWYREIGGDDKGLFTEVQNAIIEREKSKYLEYQSFLYSFESIIAHNDKEKDQENIEKVIKRKEEVEKDLEATKKVLDYYIFPN